MSINGIVGDIRECSSYIAKYGSKDRSGVIFARPVLAQGGPMGQMRGPISHNGFGPIWPYLARGFPMGKPGGCAGWEVGFRKVLSMMKEIRVL